MTEDRFAVQLPGLDLKNPFMPSSGSFYYGLDHMKDFDLNKMGALVLKTTTVDERRGNPQPWIINTQAGIMNSVGLANPGMDKVATEILPELETQLPDLPVMISIAGESAAEYRTLAKVFDKFDYIKALELNLSCPNVDRGGMEFGVDPDSAAEVVAAVREVTDKPLYAKLSPNVTDIKPIAKAVETAGADGLVLINTVVGMSLDIASRQVRLYRGTGGISGASVHPIAVRMVWEAASVVDIPIIGVGGIRSMDDALELMLAGASAVQIGAMNAEDPLFISKLVDELPVALDKYNFASVREIPTALQKFPAPLTAWEANHPGDN